MSKEKREQKLERFYELNNFYKRVLDFQGMKIDVSETRPFVHSIENHTPKNLESHKLFLKENLIDFVKLKTCPFGVSPKYTYKVRDIGILHSDKKDFDSIKSVAYDLFGKKSQYESIRIFLQLSVDMICEDFRSLAKHFKEFDEDLREYDEDLKNTYRK